MATYEPLLPTPNTMEALPPKPLERIVAYNQKARPGRSYLSQNLRELVRYGQRKLDGTYLRVGFPVSHSVKQVKEEAQATIVFSGRKCLELYNLQSRHGSLLKTCVDYLLSSKVWYSNMCALTWKGVVTKSNRLLFQLYPSTPRIGETESGLSPTMLKTPSASEAEGGWKVADKYWNAKAPKLKMRDQVGRKTGLMEWCIKILFTVFVIPAVIIYFLF